MIHTVGTCYTCRSHVRPIPFPRSIRAKHKHKHAAAHERNPSTRIPPISHIPPNDRRKLAGDLEPRAPTPAGEADPAANRQICPHKSPENPPQAAIETDPRPQRAPAKVAVDQCLRSGFPTIARSDKKEDPASEDPALKSTIEAKYLIFEVQTAGSELHSSQKSKMSKQNLALELRRR